MELELLRYRHSVFADVNAPLSGYKNMSFLDSEDEYDDFQEDAFRETNRMKKTLVKTYLTNCLRLLIT